MKKIYQIINFRGQSLSEFFTDQSVSNLDVCVEEKSHMEKRIAFQETMEECIKAFKSFFIEFFRFEMIPKILNDKERFF